LEKERKDILQAATAIAPEDSAEAIGQKVLALEHQYFAGVIEGLL
jgi:folate-dependent phosphoribosylglycinamide formyltransferase PurN